MTSQSQPAIFTSIEAGVSIEAYVAFQGTMSHKNAEVPICNYHTKIAFISQSRYSQMRKSISGSIEADTHQRVSGPTMNILQSKRVDKSERDIHILAEFIQCKQTRF